MSSSTPPLLNPQRMEGSPWSVADAAAFLAVSPRHLLRLIEAKKVKSILLGRRRLIPDAEVRRIASEGV